MGKRVSHSPLDPWINPLVKGLYPRLPIPRRFPPEGIILVGHLSAVAAAFGFAFAPRHWWGGLLVAAGVAGNHVADILDGTHARATGQCRNGGELLDHFTDPLSFAYYVIGLAASCGRLDLGLAGVIGIYATSVLTNIRAKMIGEFTLARFGPTEFKALLVAYGVAQVPLAAGAWPAVSPHGVALWFFVALLVVGIAQLVVNLARAVIEVNRHGAPPDVTEWNIVHARPEGAAERPALRSTADAASRERPTQP